MGLIPVRIRCCTATLKLEVSFCSSEIICECRRFGWRSVLISPRLRGPWNRRDWPRGGPVADRSADATANALSRFLHFGQYPITPAFGTDPVRLPPHATNQRFLARRALLHTFS